MSEKDAIKNNIPIEEKLHMITCISNICNYSTRYSIARDFIKRIETNNSVLLYIVELCYNNQEFKTTCSNNPRHLQIRTNQPPLWVKENLWNIGTSLLPKDWKCVAFVDADIEFDNPHFAIDTLKILNGTRDIVQMHSHALDLDIKGDTMNIFSSFGHQVSMNRALNQTGPNYPHPGYNIAMSRKTYDKIGGLYQDSLLGSGDYNLCMSLVGKGIKSLHPNMSDGYKKSILEFEKKCKGLKMGYVPGLIRHTFHGHKNERYYNTRGQILIKHQYDPYNHITIDFNGLMIPTVNCPQELLKDIYNYFKSRNEDSGLPKVEKLTINDDVQDYY